MAILYGTAFSGAPIEKCMMCNRGFSNPGKKDICKTSVCDMSILYVLQEDTISINHNWLNGCNIDIMWQFLQNELLSVQKEISEWRNTMDSWHQHCQVLLIIAFFLLKQSHLQ